jgi:hypothetical protein
VLEDFIVLGVLRFGERVAVVFGLFVEFHYFPRFTPGISFSIFSFH